MPNKQISEKDCWFVIGAHQAGASERECSELAGLSKTITHNIINNFKRMGSPHASKMSLNALMNNNNDSNLSKSNKRKRKSDDTTPRKRGRPRNPPEAPFFTQAIVRNALLEVRKTNTNQGAKYHDGNDNKEPLFLLDRPHTPPNDEESISKTLNISDNNNAFFGENNTKNTVQEEDSLPPTPRSINVISDGEEEEEEEEEIVEWTLKEDEQLLNHVFSLPTKNIRWKEVQNRFQDRHFAKMCSERWEYLKKQIIKDIQQIDRDKSAFV